MGLDILQIIISNINSFLSAIFFIGYSLINLMVDDSNIPSTKKDFDDEYSDKIFKIKKNYLLEMSANVDGLFQNYDEKKFSEEEKTAKYNNFLESIELLLKSMNKFNPYMEYYKEIYELYEFLNNQKKKIKVLWIVSLSNFFVIIILSLLNVNTIFFICLLVVMLFECLLSLFKVKNIQNIMKERIKDINNDYNDIPVLSDFGVE